MRFKTHIPISHFLHIAPISALLSNPVFLSHRIVNAGGGDLVIARDHSQWFFLAESLEVAISDGTLAIKCNLARSQSEQWSKFILPRSCGYARALAHSSRTSLSFIEYLFICDD